MQLSNRVYQHLRDYGFAVGLAAILTLCVIRPAAFADDPTVDAIDRYLREETARVTEQSRMDLSDVDAASWPETQRRWREELRVMLGIDAIGEPGELLLEITDSFKVPGVKVQNLHYQSLPGLYVPANLYLPEADPPEGGWPAVLYVCGHSRQEVDGRLYGNKTGYHHHGLWFARHGVACLTIDTVQLGELHGEHHGTYRLGRWDWFSRGYTPAGVEALNAIRGVDLLCSLPEVDASRIGITGRSGGGAYSWFAAALDDRIKVAVPVAGITDLQNHVVDRCVEGHCDCMYFVNYGGWDYNKLAALVAPRPLLLANSDNDNIFPLDGVLRIHDDLKDFYEQLGKPENFRLLITPGPHADTQELQTGAFRWLLDHLKGPGTVVDLPANKELDPSQLRVYGVKTPADQRVTDVALWLPPTAEPVDSDEAAAGRWQTAWSKRLSAAGATEDSLPAVLKWRERIKTTPKADKLGEGTAGEYRWRRYDVDSGLGHPIGVLLVGQGDDISGSELLLAPLGQDDWNSAVQIAEGDGSFLDRSRWGAWLEEGDARAVALVAPLGVGPTHSPVEAKRQAHRLRSFYLLGTTLETVQLGDLLSVAAYFEGEAGFEKVGFGGVGRSAVTAAIASLQTEPPRRLWVAEPETDPLLAPSLLGVLRVCTYEDLLSAAEQLSDGGQLPPPGSDTGSGGLDSDHLLDPATGPWQAMGVRVLNVESDRAVVMARTTRHSLPNLADLPEFDSVQHREEDGMAGLRHAMPGMPGEVRVRYRAGNRAWQETPWQSTDAQGDYIKRFELTDLQPGVEYDVQVIARAVDGEATSSTSSATFQTLPNAGAAADIRIAILGAQKFEDRDGPFGFEVHRTIQARGADAVVFACGCGCGIDGDATAEELYQWQRLAGLSTSVDLFRDVPAYFAGSGSGPGCKSDDVPAGDRSYRFGKDLQLWLIGPASGSADANGRLSVADRLEWIKGSVTGSAAMYKVVVASVPTPGSSADDAESKLAAGILNTLEGSGSATAIFCGGSQPPAGDRPGDSPIFVADELIELILTHPEGQVKLVFQKGDGGN